MPQPWSEPRTRVLRISRSRVPWSRSARGATVVSLRRDTLSFDNRTAVVGCQGIARERASRSPVEDRIEAEPLPEETHLPNVVSLVHGREAQRAEQRAVLGAEPLR